MRRTTSQMIEESIKEGYVLLAEGKGNCNEMLDKYRAEGYDVRSWYLSRSRTEANPWVMYGRKIIRKSRKAVTIDYSTLTVKELRKICSMKKIPNYSKLSKAEIVQKLTEAC